MSLKWVDPEKLGVVSSPRRGSYPPGEIEYSGVTSPMRAEIIAIGSELVSGQSLDTNSRWLSQRSALGIPVAFHTTLGDDLADHLAAFRTAFERADLVIMTGGLGPTQDDLTREALAACAGVPLGEDPDSLAAIRDVRPPESADGRAESRPGPVPRRRRAAGEPVGTAPGIWMELGPARSRACPASLPR